jgi:DNA-3-methyladenine glycosylase
MFLPAGHWYVYPIHSRHCVNVVTQPHGVGSAVLIRALQSWEGLDAMQENRQLTPRENRTYITASQRTCRELTSGPGRLCQALGIDRRYDGLKICADTGLWIETLSPSALSPRRWKIRSSPRIGIRRSVDLPLRWFIDGNIFVSGLARQHTDGRKWLFSHS